ncbi:glycoside hydrolase family 88/105 protein [Geofilum sp. OHC36d9]|uniref:glycoside hydrolase family 88/105 protein n=1 Tax=Geofilum sp. OHC36d9 TaxID=3458413 RepID=UPI004033DDC3
MKTLNTFLIGGLMTVLACSCGGNTNEALLTAEKMAVSDMARNPEPWMIDFREKPKWEYTHGLMMNAYLALYHETNNEAYLDYVKKFADMFVNEDGSIKTYKQTDYNIDRVNPGKFLIELYQITGEERLLKAINLLRDQMRQHPRIEAGGFWHKKIYPNQMWLDGLYMGSPFLAQYGSVFGEYDVFADVALQFRLVNTNMYDPKTGLFYHGWDASHQQQWADPETGLSPNFWGRSMGWLAMASVDALSWFPEAHPDKAFMIEMINRIAEGMVRNQDDETGLWWQVLDQPGREGNYREATVSSMMVYFLLKGVRLGYLDTKYLENAKKAYAGIMTHLIKTGEDGSLNLTECCAVAGLGGNPYRDGSYEYYVNERKRDNDPKGVGPFILAAIEMSKLK